MVVMELDSYPQADRSKVTGSPREGQNKRQRLKASAVEPVLDVCAFSAWLHPGAHLGPARETTNNNARKRR
jgi:hypothetical protein